MESNLAARLWQLISDILSYYAFYNPGIGYTAHLSGYLFGFSLSAATFFRKKPLWKRIFAFTGYVFLSIELTFLITHYAYWPPKLPHFQASLDPDVLTCCSDAFSLATSTGASLDHIMAAYECSGQAMIKKGFVL
jgi:hypothetical protein